MRIPLRNWISEHTLFFTAGNLPTQQAYGVTPEEVSDAFVVSLLRSDRVLLAASFFFESAATRDLVRKFPSVWRPDAKGGLFFINTTYASVVDHGLGKIEKSPRHFDPYANPEVVRTRGLLVDQLGQVGVRDDVDISAVISGAWIRSCMSSDPGSVGAILQSNVPPSLIVTATAYCLTLAERRQHDFIWPSIQAEIRGNPILEPVHVDLRRVLADLYSEVMSVALGAVDTTPTLSPVAYPITERGVGHLGRFNSVLRRVGIEPRRIQEDQILLGLLNLDELDLLRRLDDEVLKSALELQQSAAELWRAICLSEERLPARPHLTDLDIRRALTLAFDAIGVTATEALTTRVHTVERLYGGAFLSFFRNRVQEILERRLEKTIAPAQARTQIAFQDVVLFVAADPNVGGPTTRVEADRELKEVEAALRNFGDRAAVRVQPLLAAEADEIGPAVTTYHPRFFHFSGHGDAEGYIFMQAPAGGRAPVRIETVLNRLGLAPVPVECALFHSCYSLSALRGLTSKVARYLILSSGQIGEQGARVFSHEFYLAIGSGLDVPQAFANARSRLILENLDAELLQLFERADDMQVVGPGEFNAPAQLSSHYRRRA